MGSGSLWLLGAAMLAAGVWTIRRSLAHNMWLDELYTATLIATPSLGQTVDGALRGVDGNPPLYLSLCWVLIHLFPISSDALLRPLNLALLAATAIMLTRIGRRVADTQSVAVALALVCAFDDTAVYALLEVRTYALYLCLVTATLWATLAVVDRPSMVRSTLLAMIGVLAALAHSFGGFYVLATIGAAGMISCACRDRVRVLTLVFAALPPAATTLVWIYISFATQLAVATPYGWIPSPHFTALVEALTGSTELTLLGLLFLAWLAARGQVAPCFSAWRKVCTQRDRAILIVIPAAYAALTAAGWVGSQLTTPFFVGRYFTPNLLVAALMMIFAAAVLRRLAPPRMFAPVAALCCLVSVTSVATRSSATADLIPCVSSEGRFLEDGIDPDLPVVIESPHAWLPRNHYAPARTALYPLDWDVVLDHPHRARNNAMDFHIMDILKHWAPPGSALANDVLPTAAILAGHPQFLLLDEINRSWLRELRAQAPLSATLLGQSPGCRLWRIDRVRP